MRVAIVPRSKQGWRRLDRRPELRKEKPLGRNIIVAIIAELSLEVDSQNSLDMHVQSGLFLLHGYLRFQRAVSVESPLGLGRKKPAAVP